MMENGYWTLLLVVLGGLIMWYGIVHIRSYNVMHKRKGIIIANIGGVCLAVGIISFFVVLFQQVSLSCKYEEIESLSGSDVNIEINSADKMARIEIVDTYTKDGTKYYIVKTDISGSKKWTLSEEEYDAYIGLGNDAVDCMVYILQYETDIFSYHYNFVPASEIGNGSDLLEILREIPGCTCTLISEYEREENQFSEISISKADEFDWYDNGNRRYSMYFINDGEKDIIKISCKVMISRYSCVGETDFTEEEVDSFITAINDVNRNVYEQCRKVIEE